MGKYNKYTEKDAAKETKVSIKEVKRAWHQARNDAAKEGGKLKPGNRPVKK